MQASACEAKASFSSITSKSPIFRPSRSISLRVDGTGPMPMMRGGTPADAMPRMRARGVRPCAFTAASDAMIIAAAPSFTPDALPAVTVPGSRNGVLSLARAFERRLGARMLVRVDHRPADLAARSRPARSPRRNSRPRSPCRRAAASASAKASWSARVDLEFLRDVLAGLRHRIDAVLLLHQRIDEAPADGGVVDFGRARERLGRLAHARTARASSTRPRPRSRNRCRPRGSPARPRPPH